MVDIYRSVSVLVLQIYRKNGTDIFKVLENQKNVTIEIYLLNVLFYCIPWDFLHIERVQPFDSELATFMRHLCNRIYVSRLKLSIFRK